MKDPKKEHKKPTEKSPEYQGEGISDKMSKRMDELSDRLEEKGEKLEELVGDKARQLEEALSPENIDRKMGQAVEKGGEVLKGMQQKWKEAQEQSRASREEKPKPTAEEKQKPSYLREREERANASNNAAYQRLQDALNKQDGNQKRAKGTCPEAVEDEAYYQLLTAKSLVENYAPKTEWADKSSQQLSRIFNKATEKGEILQVAKGREKTYPAYLVDRENGRFYKETAQILEKLSQKMTAEEMHAWFLTENKHNQKKPADMMATARGRIGVKSMARVAAR